MSLPRRPEANKVEVIKQTKHEPGRKGSLAVKLDTIKPQLATQMHLRLTF